MIGLFQAVKKIQISNVQISISNFKFQIVTEFPFQVWHIFETDGYFKLL